MTFKTSSGAAGKSALTGTSLLSSIVTNPKVKDLAHPIAKCFQTTAWWCARRIWYDAALSVGGSFSGWGTFLLVDDRLQYAAYCILFKLSSVLPSYNRTINWRPSLNDLFSCCIHALHDVYEAPCRPSQSYLPKDSGFTTAIKSRSRVASS